MVREVGLWSGIPGLKQNPVLRNHRYTVPDETPSPEQNNRRLLTTWTGL